MMVKLPGSLEQAWKKALELEDYFTNEVFKQYPSLVLEAEKIYFPYLLLETKKRYIGRMSENPHDLTQIKLDYKGIELKRSDSVGLMREVQKELLNLIMPLNMRVDVRIAATRPKIIHYLTTFLEKLIDNEYPISMYVKSKTSKSKYKGSLPEHMVVFHRHNHRIQTGKMTGQMYNIGDRPKYIVTYKKTKSKKLVDRVECAKFFEQFPEECPKLDRLYYLNQIYDAIKKLLVFHVPDLRTMVETAYFTIQRQLQNQTSVCSYFDAEESDTVKALPSKLPTKKKRRAVQKKSSKKATQSKTILDFF